MLAPGLVASGTVGPLTSISLGAAPSVGSLNIVDCLSARAKQACSHPLSQAYIAVNS